MRFIKVTLNKRLMDEIKLGRYRHYKGDFYEVIGVAKHSETKEELVIYRSLKDRILWARPKGMFLEKIMLEGKETPRFTFVENQ